MNLLVIGGTRFVGRHIVDEALRRGHTLTLFNRGQSNPGLFAGSGVEEIHGDRDGDLGLLAGRCWDAVVDTNGYLPRIVRASAEFLAQAVDRYLFVSTISVYADPMLPETDEDAPLAVLDEPAVEEIRGGTYGGLKVLCERAVQDAYGPAALIIRPGLIVGPHDYSDRFTYWPVRVSRGGRILAPGDGAQPVQFIDARDLAAWSLDLLENGKRGVYNATGPAERLTIGQFLQTCDDLVPGNAQFAWVDEDFLLAHDVSPYTELPLWIPGEEGEAHGTVQIARAIAEGLTFRPLQETIQDTLKWAQQRDSQHEWRAGLTQQREAELLQAWDQRDAAEA